MTTSYSSDSQFDVFVSHASEDKEAFVRPLAEALSKRGLQVWFDEFCIQPGDSIRASIDAGLREARTAIVILSPAFFARQWTEWELNAIVQRHLGGQGKFIFPIWHNVTRADVMRHYPPLADLLAMNSKGDVAALADELASIIKAAASQPHEPYTSSSPKSTVPSPTGMTRIARVLAEGAHILSVVDASEFRLTVLEVRRDRLAVIGRSVPSAIASITFPIAGTLAGFAVINRSPIEVGDTSLVAEANWNSTYRSVFAAPIYAGSPEDSPTHILTIDSSKPGAFKHDHVNRIARHLAEIVTLVVE